MGPKAHGIVAEVSRDMNITLSLVGRHGGEVGSVVVSMDTLQDLVKDVLAQAEAISKPSLRLVE